MSIAPSPSSPSETLLLNSGSRHPSGKVLFIEDFTPTNVNHYFYYQIAGGTGTLTYYSTANTRQNCWRNKSLAILSTGVNGGGIEIYKPMYIPANRRVGIEIMWGFPYSLGSLRTRLGSLSLLLYFYQNYRWSQAEVQYNPDIPRLVIRDGNNQFNTLFTFDGNTDTESAIDTQVIWHNAKLIVDGSTLKYERLYYDGLEFDLGSHTMHTEVTGVYGAIFQAGISMYDFDPATQFTMYLGALNVTNEE